MDTHLQFQRAITLIEKDEFSNAEVLLQEVLAKNPSHTGALVNYIKCLEQQQRRVEALPLMGLLQSLHPENLLFTLAYVEALSDAKRYDDAVFPLRLYLEKGDLDVQAVTALAQLYFQLGDKLNATAYIHWALSLDSAEPKALIIAADIACSKLRYEEANQLLARYIKIQPEDLRVRLKLGDVLEKRGLVREALTQFTYVCEREPENSDLWTLTGRLLTQLRQVDKAKHALEQAIRLNPKSAMALYHFGNVLSEMGEHKKAMSFFEKSIASDSKFSRAHYNLSLCYFSLGYMQAGFAGYHWRWSIPAHLENVAKIPLPKWTGDIQSNTRLLVWTEQGIGDGIFFGQALAVFEKMAAESKLSMDIIFACDTRLKTVFAKSLPSIRVISHNDEILRHLLQQESKPTHQIAIGDLMALLWSQYQLGDFPAAVSKAKELQLALFEPYLKPSISLKQQILTRQIQAFKIEKGYAPSFRIGISWHSIGQRAGESRSVPLHTFAPMIKANPDIQWVSLQYGDHKAEIQRLQKKIPKECQFFVDNEIDAWGDLDGMIAQISALDLVISIDNSTVHMSGSLGVPTWLLLRDVHNWRWPVSGDETYWYSNMSVKRWNTQSLKQTMAMLGADVDCAAGIQ